MREPDEFAHGLLGRDGAFADPKHAAVRHGGQLGFGNRVKGTALVGIGPPSVHNQRRRGTVAAFRQLRHDAWWVDDVTVGKEEAARQLVDGVHERRQYVVALPFRIVAVSYTHLRAHETDSY